MQRLHVLAALAASTFAVGASAQNLKPGLWEVTNTIAGSGDEMASSVARMQKQMASMPPEQRRKMGGMMSKQSIQAAPSGPDSMSVKTCMTKAMAQQNTIAKQQGDCKITKQERRGNTIDIAYTCATPPSRGEGQYVILSPEAYTMRMNLTRTGTGKPRTSQLQRIGEVAVG